MVTDRYVVTVYLPGSSSDNGPNKSAATTCLIAYIATLHPYYMLPAQFLIALDLSSHYMHMVATLSAGSASHKAIGAEGNRWLRLYYENKVILQFSHRTATI